MKLRLIIPIFVLAVASVAAGVWYFNQPVSADQYEARIKALEADMSEYQKEADRLNGESISLANTLAQLANEKSALQSQIDLNQAQHDKLVIDIADTEVKIKENQDALGVTIADLYVDDSISPIEMLFSSKGVSDYINKQEYRNSISEELGNTISRIKSLKAELTDKKEEVVTVLDEQKQARATLVARENEQSSLLAQTESSEANYQNLIKDNKSKIAEARAQQAAMNARANQNGGYTVVNSGLLSDYPWNNITCPMGGTIPGYGWVGWASTKGEDGNGGDGKGYGCRQCASYAAWRVAKETGKYYEWGNGGDFARNAVNAGYRNLGRSPEAGSLAVMWGTPGHVAWVEAVSGDFVTVSQYNWQVNGQWGMYSLMTLHKSTFDQYVKIV